MNTIQQAVSIPADRRLQLDLLLPDSFPAGEAEMLIVFTPAPKATSGKSLSHLAGCLAKSAAFAADPVEIQGAVRDKW